MTSDKRKIHRLIAFAAAVAITVSPALSYANMTCLGPVTFLGVDSGGGVVVAVSGTNIHTICNTVDQGSYTVNTQACKMFYAALLADQISGRAVQIFYNDPALTACSQIGGWSTQPSVYFLNQN